MEHIRVREFHVAISRWLFRNKQGIELNVKSKHQEYKKPYHDAMLFFAIQTTLPIQGVLNIMIQCLNLFLQ